MLADFKSRIFICGGLLTMMSSICVARLRWWTVSMISLFLGASPRISFSMSPFAFLTLIELLLICWITKLAMSDKLNIKPLEYVNQLELRNNGVDIFKAIDDIIVNSADVITDIIRDNEDPRIKLNAINTAVKIRRQLFEEKQFLVRLDLEKDKYAETKIDWGDAGIE